MGAGTGAEILDLAEAYPGWRFTTVDPSKPMLDRCRARTDEAGLRERCSFVEGYVDTVPAASSFDGATAILVSQFLLDEDERRAFFRAIAARLAPQAPLVMGDLACHDLASEELELWKRAWLLAGIPAENVAKIEEVFENKVAVLRPGEVANIIAESGFDAPLRSFQCLLMYSWIARRARHLPVRIAAPAFDSRTEIGPKPVACTHPALGTRVPSSTKTKTSLHDPFDG